MVRYAAVCLALCLAACSSTQRSAGTTQPVVRVLDTVVVQVGDGAPTWCAQLLTANVLSLPAALAGMEDPARAAAAETVLTAAASDLTSVIDAVPPDVRGPVELLIAGLRSVAADPSDADALTALAESLQAMDATTQSVCEFEEAG